MKRDVELIRKILFYIEENYKPMEQFMNVSIEGYDISLVKEHCLLAYEAGLIRKAEIGKTFCMASSLTNAGFDFLDSIREESIWTKTKNVAKKKGIPLLIDTIKAIANSFITAATQGVTNSIISGGKI